MKGTLIIMVTNGAGLGHLTRGLAVAKRLRQMAPQLQIIFFSTSIGLEMIRNEGFMFYYIPTHKMMPESVDATMWNNYMFRHLQEIISFYKPIGIVFDGAYPYGGVIAQLKQYETLKCVWIKREGYKENVSHMEKLEEVFGRIIVPKELEGNGEETSKKKFCNPILLLDRQEACERETMRATLGIHKKERLIYVQLGAGNINPIEQLVEWVTQILLKDTKNHILLGMSPIGKTLQIQNSRVIGMRQYPNAYYFKGIDLAISAAGYNTFNELTYFQVPTLYIPNERVLKDDQRARAQLAQKKGIGLCLEELTSQGIEKAVHTLYTHESGFREKAKGLIKDNGAYEAAHSILEFLKIKG